MKIKLRSVGFLAVVVGGLGLLVVVGWLFLVGSGHGLCCLYCFFGSRIYYFIIVGILFYCVER